MPKPRVAIAIDLEWSYKSHADTFAGIMRYAETTGGWSCVVDDCFQDVLSRSRGGELPYEGVIGRINAAQARAIRRAGLPAVNVWYGSPAKDLPGVHVDPAAIGRLRAEHLMELGVKNFTTLNIPDDPATQAEVQAFERRVRREGYPCFTAALGARSVDLQASGNMIHHPRKTEKDLQCWLDRWEPPIGVSITTDHIGRKVAQMCANRAWRIPDQVALVVGYNEAIICEQPAPSLTSVEGGFDRVGYRAAVLLHRLMAGERVPAEDLRQRVAPLGIVARASTDFLAVDDELVAAAMQYISKHFHKPVGVDDVALAVHTSRATLVRRFREHLRRSVGQEIRRMRLSRARRALVSSDEPIASIARRCGYPWPGQFSRAFQAEHGTTPTAYRRSRR